MTLETRIGVLEKEYENLKRENERLQNELKDLEERIMTWQRIREPFLKVRG